MPHSLLLGATEVFFCFRVLPWFLLSDSPLRSARLSISSSLSPTTFRFSLSSPLSPGACLYLYTALSPSLCWSSFCQCLPFTWFISLSRFPFFTVWRFFFCVLRSLFCFVSPAPTRTLHSQRFIGSRVVSLSLPLPSFFCSLLRCHGHPHLVEDRSPIKTPPLRIEFYAPSETLTQASVFFPF